jgi:hypothetical protein
MRLLATVFQPLPIVSLPKVKNVVVTDPDYIYNDCDERRLVMLIIKLERKLLSQRSMEGTVSSQHGHGKVV